MFVVVATMVVGLAVAAGVAVYVAFPHRGADTPVFAPLGRVMRRGVDALPVLEETSA